MVSARYDTVVVGAAQGIGEAVVRRMARSRKLLIADIDGPKLQELEMELRSLGQDVSAQPVDITDSESIAELIAAAGDVNYLALVAGVFQAAPSLSVEPKDFNRIFAVNTIGTYDVARQFAAGMSENGHGAICAVGSIAARMPRMRQAAYSASKAAMRQALRVLAMEVIAQGVRINFVAPGPTETPMMLDLAADHDGVSLADGELETFRPRVPDRRLAKPDDIAAAMEYLLSEDASHVVMHDLYVDGGESLGI